ncbi:MAG: radical SAM protein [Candidatus Paceibacterota bacterium]
MKICLIIPPSTFLLDERVFMTLGILRVASAMETAGWQVQMIDLSGIVNYTEVVRDYLSSSDVDLIGLTATTAQLPAAVEISRVIKQGNPDTRVILGGPHPTLVLAAQKREKSRGVKGRAGAELARLQNFFDVLVAGDGEKAVFEAVAPDAARVIDADGRATGLFLTDRELDALPLPARHLVDVSSYHYQIDGHPALSLIAQLGCPFACGFCAGRHSPMLRHTRTRSSKSIVEEIVFLYKTYGHTGFMFYDDELNVSKSMVELMNLIGDAQERLGVEWRLRGFVKAELFTEEQAAAMYRAGFRWLLVGFESGSPRILENIQKRATRDDNTRCLEIAHKHGLKVKALMSLGHPGESWKTAKETEDWLLAARPEDFDVTIITPYPGSPYYDDADFMSEQNVWAYSCKNGDRLYQADLDYTITSDYYKGDPNGGYVSHVFTDFLSAEEMVIARDNLERKVRQVLGIPFNPSVAAVLYEHSMGQTGLPANILRVSNSNPSL